MAYGLIIIKPHSKAHLHLYDLQLSRGLPNCNQKVVGQRIKGPSFKFFCFCRRPNFCSSFFDYAVEHADL